jgi:hypothetical protein
METLRDWVFPKPPSRRRRLLDALVGGRPLPLRSVRRNPVLAGPRPQR